MLPHMRSARRAEQLCGALAGALTLIAITIGALIPVSSSTFSVHEGNRLVQYAHTTTSLFQFLGPGLAGSLISAFVAFGVVFAAASVLHAHEDDPAQANQWLIGEWIAGIDYLLARADEQSAAGKVYDLDSIL